MCTGIKIDYDKGSVMGRTMDFEHPLNYNIIYLPRNYDYAKDLMGSPLSSKYMALGICFENRNPLKDGVNEHGLVGLTNAFAGFNLYENDVREGKVNISSLDYLSYALTNYKTVEEVVADLPNIHFSTKNLKGENILCPEFHFMFTDPSKRAIVIEPKRGKLVYFDNPYNVMTNSPGFESHVRRLRKTMDLDKLDEFNSSKDLPGGYDPISRFIKAFYLSKMNVKSKDQKEAFANAYNIMNAMALPHGFILSKKYDEYLYTRYICAYDTNEKLLTVKSNTNSTVYQIGFDHIKDKDTRQAFFLDREFNMEKVW